MYATRPIFGSRPKCERKRAQRRMTARRAIVGKKACRRKATTGKKHNTCACKKEAKTGRKQQTHAEKEYLTTIGLGFLCKWLKNPRDINIDKKVS
jgi:hypothetical protein